MAADYILQGTFAATGISTAVPVTGAFCLTVWGTPLGANGISGAFGGTLQLERSPDGGTTWAPCSTDGTGSPAAYSAAAAVTGAEPVFGTLYRVRCTSYASGTINYLFTTIPPHAIG